MSKNGIVRGIVTEIRDDGTAMVSVVLQEEVPEGLSRFVQIRFDHHHQPIVAGGKYSVEFGQLSKPRAPKLHEPILLRRHDRMPDLAWAWCYQNDGVMLHKPKVHLEGPVMAQSVKPAKIPYGEKVRLRRAAEQAVA